jgi:two-component system chemotaxis sensor kinase CheA
MEDLTREFLLESHEGLDRMERCLAELAEAPANPELLREIFRAVHTIKGTTGFLGFQRLERVAHAGENLLAGLRDGDLVVNAACIDVLLLLLDTLRSILRGIEQTGAEPEGADAPLLAQLEALQSLEEASQKNGASGNAAAFVKEGRYDGAAAMATTAGIVPAAIPKSKENSGGHTGIEEGEAPASVVDATVRVDVDVLQRLMNLAGELVLTRNQIVAAATEDQRIGMLAQRLDRVTGDMRDAIMRVRMQPVEQVFARFPRLVRELARQCGKQVRLEMEGQQTRLDRSVLELMRDPLLHAIRNSIDHGIEAPEMRTANGKPAEGNLRLRAASAGDHVILEIIDDGGGIFPERLRQRAVERGLISSEQAAALSDSEACNLVFVPGFSTASQVTNVSGRGIGLDVVRKNVEHAGGSVEMHSVPGQGTTIRMRLPLTLAILPALVVCCAGQRFALPQTAVVELHCLRAAEQMASIEVLGAARFYRLRNRLLPLATLRGLLRLSSDDNPSQGPQQASMQGEWNLVVLSAEGRRFGLCVDAFEGTEELVAKPLERVTEVPVFSGAAQLADGDLALILDVSALADLAGVAVDRTAVASETDTAVSLGENFLHVSLGDTSAAIPIACVEHVLSVRKAEIQSMDGTLVLPMDDEMLPLLDGAQLSHNRDADAFPAASIFSGVSRAEALHVLVCSQTERRMGLMVSAVHGMVQAEPAKLQNLSYPEESAQSILRLGEQLVRVIDPLTWQLPATYSETWTVFDNYLQNHWNSQQQSVGEITG